MKKIITFLILLFTTPAFADYTMIVPQKPGGGTSVWAQIVATEMEKYLEPIETIVRHQLIPAITGAEL